MAEMVKKNLVLSFTTAAGKEVKLMIKEPIEGLGGEMVAPVMEEIIASKALGEEGIVVAKNKAQYVIQQVEAIPLA